MPLLLILYLVCSWIVGALIITRLIKQRSTPLLISGSFLIGSIISVPITYILSCLLVFSGNPLLWATGITIVLELLVITKNRPVTITSLNISDLTLVICSLVCSSWLMMKTFHGDATGQLFVGSNNVFDFSHFLGVIRSFSHGLNVPFSSPFQSGIPYLYHFFFSFYVALWEYFGIPIVWAINIPSIFAFSSLLILVYEVPQVVFKQSKLVGWISVLLVLTNSTLTWWQLIIKNGISLHLLQLLWILPTYPFAGPFDGSIISIFMTLNNYVNQRHLAFAIAGSLLFIIVVIKQIEQKNLTRNNVVIDGLLFGFLGLWNIAVTVISILSILLLLLIKKYWAHAVMFITTCSLVFLVYFGQYMIHLNELTSFSKATVSSLTISTESWNTVWYLWMNLGILPLVVFFGYRVISTKHKIYSVPFILLGVFLCVLSAIGHQGFDQKFLSFLIIWADIIAAIGLGWLWQKRNIVVKIFATVLFIVLTMSGVIDLIPIKNEFAYPLVDKTMLPVMSWMQAHTAKNAVFVSYSDMVDPVVFSGRKNYFGFFGNIGSYDRSTSVQKIYSGDLNEARSHAISYILVPKWEKNDFPYTIDIQTLQTIYTTAYEDERYIIFAVHSPMVQ